MRHGPHGHDVRLSRTASPRHDRHRQGARGYQPIGALLVAGRIYDAIEAGTGFFQHGHTYMGHPMATAAALAVVEKISRPEMLAQVRERGAQLREGLEARFGQHPHVGDIRGRGLFVGLELVEDRQSKAPFAPERKLAARVKAEGMARGLACYPMNGTIDGARGDHILLAPPFIVTPKRSQRSSIFSMKASRRLSRSHDRPGPCDGRSQRGAAEQGRSPGTARDD